MTIAVFIVSNLVMLEILITFCEGTVKISKRSEHNIRDFWMCSTLIQWDSFRGFRSTVYTATVQVLLEEAYKTIVEYKWWKLVIQHEWLGKNCSHSSESELVATLAEWNPFSACDLNEVHNWWADSPGCRNITGKSLVNSSIQMNITPHLSLERMTLGDGKHGKISSTTNSVHCDH